MDYTLCNHILKTVKELTEEEIAFRKKNVHKPKREIPLYWAKEVATIEFPIRLYIFGNDDTSYSKFFETVEAAKEELELLIACEELDMQKDIIDNDFVFTN